MKNGLIQVGIVTLNKTDIFQRNSESADKTDFITAERQTRELYTDGYWFMAEFDGVLTATTYPKEERRIGSKDKASIQRTGFQLQCDHKFTFQITNQDYTFKDVGQYSDGSKMIRLQKKNTETLA